VSDSPVPGEFEQRTSFSQAPPPLPYQQPYSIDPSDESGPPCYRNMWVWFLIAAALLALLWLAAAIA
jgi:hypothetical protein